MKNSSFLVALLAILQILLGARQSNAQDRIKDRRTIEEALDRAGEDIGREIEVMLEELGVSADQLGRSLNRWAEENSDRIQAWQERHGDRWEAWGERLNRDQEALSQDQEIIWSDWAKRYERNLEVWSQQLDGQNGLGPDDFGELLERNLKMISEMPLGQLVDEALEKGVGDLADAPWESLGELGEMAQDALAEPLAELSDELSELADPNGRRAQRLGQSQQEIVRSLDELRRDVERNLSDVEDSRADRLGRSESDSKKQLVSDVDEKTAILEQILQRDDLPQDARDRIEQAIANLRDARLMRGDLPVNERAKPDVPSRDQILEKVEKERRRHAEAMRDFNEDLRKSSEQSRFDERRSRDRELESRRDKRTDGRDRDDRAGDRSNRQTRDPLVWFRDREKRSAQATRSKSQAGKKASNGETELEILRKEIEKLKKEIQQLKKD